MTARASLGDTEQSAESGEQGVTLGAGEAYDRIAAVYDTTYSGTKARVEDAMVADRLIAMGLLGDDVLDVGCGTGILLDLAGLAPRRYLGIDPSRGMLDAARRKYPFHEFQFGTAEAPCVGPRRFDSVVCLYGSFSYCLEPERAVQAMAAACRPGGRLFLMSCTPAHERRESYIMNQAGVRVARRFYRAAEAIRLFSQRFVDIRVEGFGWALDKVPSIAPDWVFRSVLAAEMATVGRAAPDLCCYQIIMARRA